MCELKLGIENDFPETHCLSQIFDVPCLAYSPLNRLSEIHYPSATQSNLNIHHQF